MAKHQRSYTTEFKQEAVRLTETSGKPKAQVARDLGIHESVLYRWCRKYGQDQMSSTNSTAPSRAELEGEVKRLRRENDILRQEREILKKAISICSQEQRRGTR
jgi:transposase